MRHPDDSRSRRKDRERDAPGLNGHERSTLLKLWLRQRRACIYCGQPATTIDHALPLVRGGTNHEGNLSPCCKRCNSSKAGLTVAEWRTGRRLPPMRVPLAWLHPASKRSRRPVKFTEQRFNVCAICNDMHAGKSEEICSKYVCFRIRTRNRYRERVGIPLDAPLWSRASA